MNKEIFIAENWLPSDIKTVTGTHPGQPDRQDNDIELITERIESAHIDITSGYGNWRDIGFALADSLGENGREIYHRISRFNDHIPQKKQTSNMTGAYVQTAQA